MSEGKYRISKYAIYACIIGYFIYVLYPHKMSLISPVFALIEYSMDSPVW